MSGNKEETVRQFCDVTGADENQSKFFLESSNWQLEEAISSFYEHGGNIEEAPVSAAVASPQVDSDSDMDSPPDSPQQFKKEKKKASTKFATLDSLQQESSSDEEEASTFGWMYDRMRMVVQDYFCREASCKKMITNKTQKEIDDKNECDSECKDMEEIQRLKKEVERLLSENSELRKEIARYKDGKEASTSGQAFYAGGSERSGQQILGPSKGRKDIVTEVFKSVKERGAVVFEDEPSSSSRGRGGGLFGGVGYRLGQTADDHEQVTPTTGGPQAQTEARSVRLRLYREGFTVDAGALRSYTDPDHADFLNYIRRGEIPPELSSGGEVRVSLEDRRHEPCPAHVTKQQAFTGRGHLLGSPTPAVVGAPSLGAVGAPAPAPAPDRAATQRAAQDAVQLDTAAPTTTIQFRLADGSRITGRFNHTHTVSDLHTYVSRAEPAYGVAPFTLLTAFPSAELTDLNATLADAKLLNTTLLQRLK